VLARLAAHPAKRIDELLPLNWRPQTITGGVAKSGQPEKALCAVMGLPLAEISFALLMLART